jgi:hypothetical protein
MIDLASFLVAGIPILAVIFGLVEFVKMLGFEGRALTIISMLLGIGLGLAFQISTIGMPTTFTAWFTASIFGLALGLTASGVYDFLDKRFPPTGATRNL